VEQDHVILDRLHAGDEAAFEALVTRHDRALRRVARTFVRTPAAADDVVQETWLAVIRGLEGFEGRWSLSTWIFRILVNRARTRATREARSVPFSAIEDEDRPTVDPAAFGEDGRWRSAPSRLETDPELRALNLELRQQLLRAVDDLAPAQRAVITLRDISASTPRTSARCSRLPRATSACSCTAREPACARRSRRSWRMANRYYPMSRSRL
jgi:RNA polymerase sigma-70 factor (ECF subfamily)